MLAELFNRGINVLVTKPLSVGRYSKYFNCKISQINFRRLNYHMRKFLDIALVINS